LADAHRRFRLLLHLGQHLDVLRRPDSTLAEKVKAADFSRQHLNDLDELRRQQASTHRDLASAMKHIRRHLRALAARSRRRQARAAL
jgi:hypothetical protein